MPKWGFNESKSFVQYLGHDDEPTGGHRRTAYAPMKCFALGTITLEIGGDGRNPHCVESHALDIVEVIRNSLPRPTAVFALTRVAGHRCVISSGKPVCDELRYSVRNAQSPNTPAGYLINGSRAPICGICGKDRSDQEKCSQNGSE